MENRIKISTEDLLNVLKLIRNEQTVIRRALSLSGVKNTTIWKGKRVPTNRLVEHNDSMRRISTWIMGEFEVRNYSVTHGHVLSRKKGTPFGFSTKKALEITDSED